MAKQVMQFRYYGKNTAERANNCPNNITAQNLASGVIFSKYTPIIQLGIQTLPGVRFKINNSENYIVVGATGIYNLNIDGLAEIFSLKFDPKSIELISSTPGAYLIVDDIYKSGEI